MAKFTFAQFEEAESRRGQAKNTPSAPRNQVSYFGLKNDGDEAIVRFIYKKPSEFDFVSVHQVKIGNAYRRVSCLRNPGDPISACPFCSSNDTDLSKVFNKFYVKLLEYVKDENGNIVPKARIWERPANFAKTLASYAAEYGDLSSCVFKIKRHGESRSIDTHYDLIVANQLVYKPDIYVPDFSAFEGYSLSKYAVLDKTFADMNQYVETGEFPESAEAVKPQAEIHPEPTALRTPSATSTPTETSTPAEGTPRPRRYTF